jgi:predicted lipoprotein with Yx(FWY)xxD motif
MATTAAAGAKATVKTVKNGTFGVVLVDGGGKALYRYTPDSKGKSVCTGQCLAYWPALVVKATAKPTAGAGVKASLLGTIKAAHGMRQVTYAGYPLYHYKSDAAAGEFAGQGVDGTWYVVNSKGALVKKKAPTSGGGGGYNQPTSTSGTTTDSGGGAWG